MLLFHQNMLVFNADPLYGLRLSQDKETGELIDVDQNRRERSAAHHKFTSTPPETRNTAFEFNFTMIRNQFLQNDENEFFGIGGLTELIANEDYYRNLMALFHALELNPRAIINCDPTTNESIAIGISPLITLHELGMVSFSRIGSGVTVSIDQIELTDNINIPPLASGYRGLVYIVASINQIVFAVGFLHAAYNNPAIRSSQLQNLPVIAKRLQDRLEFNSNSLLSVSDVMVGGIYIGGDFNTTPIDRANDRAEPLYVYFGKDRHENPLRTTLANHTYDYWYSNIHPNQHPITANVSEFTLDGSASHPGLMSDHAASILKFNTPFLNQPNATCYEPATNSRPIQKKPDGARAYPGE